MGLIRHRGDFANPEGDADRVNGHDRAQAGQGAVVVAGAVADAVAAPVEAGERHEEEIRIDRGRRLERLGDATSAPARVGSPGRHSRKTSGDPRPATTGSAVANPSRGERAQELERVRLVAKGMKGGDGLGAPEPRQAQALVGEAAAEGRAGAGRHRAPPGERLAA